MESIVAEHKGRFDHAAVLEKFKAQGIEVSTAANEGKAAGLPFLFLGHQVISDDPAMLDAIRSEDADLKAIAVEITKEFFKDKQGVANLRIGKPMLVEVTEDKVDADGWSERSVIGYRVEVSVEYESDACQLCECVIPRDQEHSCHMIYFSDPKKKAAVEKIASSL